MSCKELREDVAGDLQDNGIPYSEKVENFEKDYKSITLDFNTGTLFLEDLEALAENRADAIKSDIEKLKEFAEEKVLNNLYLLSDEYHEKGMDAIALLNKPVDFAKLLKNLEAFVRNNSLESLEDSPGMLRGGEKGWEKVFAIPFVLKLRKMVESRSTAYLEGIKKNRRVD